MSARQLLLRHRWSHSDRLYESPTKSGSSACVSLIHRLIALSVELLSQTHHRRLRLQEGHQPSLLSSSSPGKGSGQRCRLAILS